MPLKGLILFFVAIIPLLAFGNPAADYEKALIAYRKDLHQDAYIHLKNVLQQDPEHIPAKVLMGKILLIKGYFSDASGVFEEALDSGADIELFLPELANSYLVTGKYQQVLDLGSHYKLSAAQQFEWHLLAAAACLHLDDIKQASIHYEQAAALQPASVRLLNSKVALLLKQRNLKDAEQLISQALSLEPDNAQSIHLKAELLQSNGHLPEAQQLYEKALALEPLDPLLRRSMLRSYISQHKLDDAEKMLTSILQQTKDDPYALLLSTWINTIKLQSDEANDAANQLSAKLWKLSKQQVTEQPALLFSRALLSYVDGNDEKARSDLLSYNNAVPKDLNAVAILSDVYIKQGDNSLALQLLERYTEQLNQMPELAQRLATLYIRTNRAFKAEQLVADLRLQFPDNIDFIMLQSVVLKQMQQSDKARQLVEEQVNRHADNIPLKVNQGLFALENAEYAKALQIAEQLLNASPDNLNYLNFKAAVLLKQKNYIAADQLLKHILSVAPEHFAAQYNLANLAIMQQRYTDAIALLQPLTKLHPQHKALLTLYALAQFRAGQYDEAETTLRNLIAHGSDAAAEELLFDVYYLQQRFEPALMLVENGLKRAFLDEVLLWKKAQLLLLMQQTAAADKQLDILFGLVNKDSDKLVRLALLQRQTGNTDASLKSLQQASELTPQAWLPKLELVNHYLYVKNYAKAETLLASMSKSRPDDANILLLNGDLAMAKDNLQLAHNYYMAAVKKDPQFKLALAKLYQLAKIGIATDEFETRLRHISKKYPANEWLGRLLAEHYVNQQKTELAIAQYQTLLAANQFTDDPSVHNNLANLFIATDLTLALSHAEKAMQLAPKQAYILDTYGWILANMQQYEKAVAMLRQAHALDATDPAIRVHIAYTLVKLQRQTEATEILQPLLDSKLQFKERPMAEQLMQQISQEG